MASPYPLSKLELPIGVVELLASGAYHFTKHSAQALRVAVRPRSGRTLRPGTETPLWNELRAQLQPQVRRRGRQVLLARLLGLPRQRINAFITRGREMPDAERTLALLVWLVARQNGQNPC